MGPIAIPFCGEEENYIDIYYKVVLQYTTKEYHQGQNMKKIDEFSKVIASLNEDEKDKLLASAKGLLKTQKIVQTNSKKTGVQTMKKEAKKL